MAEKSKQKAKKQEKVTIEEVLDEIDSNDDGKVDTKEAFTYIFKSRTIIINIIALLAMFIQSKYGFVMDQSLQTEILIIVNMYLRTQTTKPIKW